MANGNKLSFLPEGFEPTLPAETLGPNPAGPVVPTGISEEQQLVQNLMASLETTPVPDPPKVSIARAIGGALADALYMRARVLAGAAPTVGPFAAEQRQQRQNYQRQKALAEKEGIDLRNKIRLISAQSDLNELNQVQEEQRQAEAKKSYLDYATEKELEEEKAKAEIDRKEDERRIITQAALDLSKRGVLPEGTDISKLTMSDIVRLQGLAATGQDDALTNLLSTVTAIEERFPDMAVVSITPTADGRFVPQFGPKAAARPKPIPPGTMRMYLQAGVLPNHPDGTPKTDEEIKEEYAQIKKAEREAKEKLLQNKLNKPVGGGIKGTVGEKLNERMNMFIDIENALGILETQEAEIRGGRGASLTLQEFQTDARLKYEPIITRIKSSILKIRSGGAVTPQEESRQLPELPDISDTPRVQKAKLEGLRDYWSRAISGFSIYGLTDEELEAHHSRMSKVGFVSSPAEEGDIKIGTR